jgi:hypothetical protein
MLVSLSKETPQNLKPAAGLLLAIFLKFEKFVQIKET